MPQPIRELSKRFLREPEMLTIAHKMLTVPAIEQVYYEVRPYQKMDALCRVLDSQGFRKALVFCATKRSVDEITVHLQQRGYQADGLHGDMNQTQRDRVMNRFRTDGIEILVATDVAARGIDVDDVDAVINYDIPTMWKAMYTGSGVLAARAAKARPLPSSRYANSTRSAKSSAIPRPASSRANCRPCVTSTTSALPSCWMKSGKPWPSALWIAGGYW